MFLELKHPSLSQSNSVDFLFWLAGHASPFGFKDDLPASHSSQLDGCFSCGACWMDALVLFGMTFGCSWKDGWMTHCFLRSGRNPVCDSLKEDSVSFEIVYCTCTPEIRISY